MIVYQLSVDVANGDTKYTNRPCRDFHAACIAALDFAYIQKGRVSRIEKLPEASKENDNGKA